MPNNGQNDQDTISGNERRWEEKIRGAESVSDSVWRAMTLPEIDIELFYLLAGKGVDFVTAEDEDLTVAEEFLTCTTGLCC